MEPWVTGERDATLLGLGHHNPSWQWDGDHPPADETRGTPGAEQFGRGTRFFTTGQAWTGRRHQFDLRALFDAAGMSAFLAGHSHRDRLSRTVPSAGGFADVVETPGPHSPNDGRYHYVEYADRDGDGRPEGELVDDHSQAPLADSLLDGEGTLYVNCTTSASSTGQYWGWRPLSVDTVSGDVTIASEQYGYPATEEFLADRAVYPDSWNPDHSEVGLYSHPSYRLSVDTVTDTGTESAVRIENDLATPVRTWRMGHGVDTPDRWPGQTGRRRPRRRGSAWCAKAGGQVEPGEHVGQADRHRTRTVVSSSADTS